MNFFTALDISASGLSAQQTRLNVSSSNLANMESTRSPEGGPYKRREAVFAATPLEGGFGAALHSAAADVAVGENLAGVEVAEIKRDDGPGRMVYDPGHPDADEDGYVAYPDINPLEEMVNIMLAGRSYEANLNAATTAKNMAQKALEIMR